MTLRRGSTSPGDRSTQDREDRWSAAPWRRLCRRSWVFACLFPIALTSRARAADATYTESPRTAAIEIKIGGYKPLIDREASLTGKPYEQIFGASSMILVELEVDKMLYQGIGTAGVGFSIGYAEKYAPATVAQSDPNAQPIPANESTSLKVLPMHLQVFYKMDYAALHWGVPLTPYGKAALVYIPWWAGKGGNLQFVDGNRAAGGKWGYGFTAGLALLLDFFEPRLAKDFDTDLGVNHTYIFGEYVYENVNNFGKRGLDLSSRRWMFGLALEF